MGSGGAARGPLMIKCGQPYAANLLVSACIAGSLAERDIKPIMALDALLRMKKLNSAVSN